MVVKTAYKNSHSVLRKVEKRTEFDQFSTKPDCQCLIPNGHNQLRVYPSATDSGATRWSHFARRITF